MTTMRTEKEAPAFIACSFSAGLDDLPRRLQSDVVAVLRVLERAGRYSAFEASDNMTIARMMTRLHHKGCSIVRNGVRTNYGRLIETDEARSAYPWTYIRLTDAARRLLADAAEEAKP